MCLTVRSMRIMEQLDQDGLICKSKFLGEDEMAVKVEFYNFLFWCSCTGPFALMNARAESQTLWPSALQT
jgi:hypothetical protein